MRDGGKGDKPRPFNVSLEKFDKQFDDIFGKTQPRYCLVCNKSKTWCNCKEKRNEEAND